MTADEALVVDRRHQLPLHRARVGDDAVGRRRGEYIGDGPGECGDRRRDERRVGVRECLVQGERRLDRAGFDRRLGLGVDSDHRRAEPRASRQPDRSSDQTGPDDDDPHAPRPEPG